MRHGTVAFLATTALLIPAGFSQLGAGSSDEPAASRLPAEILAVGNANVQVSLDRRSVRAGDVVHVKLIASSETTRDVDVTVALMEQRGSEMARVMPPPVTVEKEDIRLVATSDGGAPRELAFRLQGVTPPKGADLMEYAGRTTQYTVVVTSATTAKMQTKRQRELAEEDELPGGAVAIPVMAERPAAYVVSVDAPPDVAAGQPFDVVVKVKNTSNKRLRGINLNLGMFQSGEGTGALFDEYAETAEGEVTLGDGKEEIDSLAPGRELSLRYTIKPGADLQRVNLRASAWAEYGGPAHTEHAVELRTVTGPSAVAAR